MPTAAGLSPGTTPRGSSRIRDYPFSHRPRSRDRASSADTGAARAILPRPKAAGCRCGQAEPERPSPCPRLPGASVALVSASAQCSSSSFQGLHIRDIVSHVGQNFRPTSRLPSDLAPSRLHSLRYVPVRVQPRDRKSLPAHPRPTASIWNAPRQLHGPLLP